MESFVRSSGFEYSLNAGLENVSITDAQYVYIERHFKILKRKHMSRFFYDKLRVAVCLSAALSSLASLSSSSWMWHQLKAARSHINERQVNSVKHELHICVCRAHGLEPIGGLWRPELLASCRQLNLIEDLTQTKRMEIAARRGCCTYHAYAVRIEWIPGHIFGIVGQRFALVGAIQRRTVQIITYNGKY